MPYLCAIFDEATQAVIADAAKRFAEHSNFTEFEPKQPFHIPIIGGLHVYTASDVHAAVVNGGQVTDAPIEGWFTHWSVSTKATLRIGVSLSSHEGLARVSSGLPRGREWRDELYTDVGSLAAIAPSEWDAFLEAVNSTFPITESSSFVCPTLDFITMPKKRHKKAGLNPTAKPFRPGAGVHQRGGRKAPKPSPNKKWVRPGLRATKPATAQSSTNMEHDTGNTGRVAIKKKRPQKPRAGQQLQAGMLMKALDLKALAI